MSDEAKKVYDDLDFATNRIGEQTRNISIGVLAIAWLFLAGGKSAPAISGVSTSTLLISGAFAMGALLVDYFQYLFAYCSSKEVLNKYEADREKHDEVKPEYDYKSLLYRARNKCFCYKQAFCLISVVVLIFGIVKAIFFANF